jgi:hypothetical protein
MNTSPMVAALWLGFVLTAGAEPGVEKYTAEEPPFAAKLPVHCSSLKEFVEVGRAVAYSESYAGVFEVWKRWRAKQVAGKASNAWIEIEEDRAGAAVCAKWSVGQAAGAAKGAAKLAASIHQDELPLLEAIQRYAIKETGFPEVVGMEVKMVIWNGFPNATLAITHNRFAMSWDIHLRKGEQKAMIWLLVFPAKPKEEGKTLGKNGLRLLHIYEDKLDDDEWSLMIKKQGGSGWEPRGR